MFCTCNRNEVPSAGRLVPYAATSRRCCFGESATRNLAWLIDLRGEVDISNIWKISTAINDAFNSHNGPVVFQIEDVSFCDSQLLNLIIRIGKSTRTAVASPRASFTRLLSVTGLQNSIEILSSIHFDRYERAPRINAEWGRVLLTRTGPQWPAEMPARRA
ncbi:STAS domain-containing protein [Streptomyces sp. NPDC101149]|uniref:STAS domain-containing protein n=1 Tax=Streptomyces sp. NPDC101149 TaxID=3366113 RepID=UPI00382F2689